LIFLEKHLSYIYFFRFSFLEWLQAQVDVLIPCPACQIAHPNATPHMWPLRAAEDAVSRNQIDLVCDRCQANVRVDAIVPDISLAELNVPRLLATDVQDEVRQRGRERARERKREREEREREEKEKEKEKDKEKRRSKRKRKRRTRKRKRKGKGMRNRERDISVTSFFSLLLFSYLTFFYSSL
jgi:hypothetical protein